MVTLEEEDTELPQLSAETFSALAEFYKEQDEREQQQEEARVLAASGEDIDWREDWQLSQFWYSEETAVSLARAVLSTVSERKGERKARVACVSAPTLYRACRKLDTENTVHFDLFEFDKRFAVYGKNFYFYDYKSPLSVERGLREQYDLVFADPPFLSEECLTKTLVTVRFLCGEGGKVVLCTGAVMAELANRLADLTVCSYQPVHQNSLSNPFQCFANFDLDKHIENSKS